MITAIALVQSVATEITELGQNLAGIQGVAEVYSFTGKNVDLIAILHAGESEQILKIADQLSKSDGVLNVDTHIAFRHYSNMDIQAGFSLGFNHFT